MDVRTGTQARVRRVVGDDDTADALGSGSLPVLATPRLLAWCEAATCAALEGALAAGETSVGTDVRLEHLAPSAVGDEVDVVATVTRVEGRAVGFAVEARDGAGTVLGRGTVERVVVDGERFLARLAGRG